MRVQVELALHLPSAHPDDPMRRHHEELAIASSVWPALSLLVPFSAALWARIRSAPKAADRPREDAAER